MPSEDAVLFKNDDSSQAGMLQTRALNVPQMGEGLRRAKVVRLLKRAGEAVILDEPIFEIETDKTTFVVEAFCSGMIQEWLVKEGDEVAVHSTIGYISTEHRDDCGGKLDVVPMAHVSSQENAGTLSERLPVTGVRVPPRILAFCRSRGLDREQIKRIPARTNTLTEEDILHYLAAQNEVIGPTAGVSESRGKAPTFEEYPLTHRQQAIVRNAMNNKSNQLLPAVVHKPVPGKLLTEVEVATCVRWPEIRPTQFQIIVYCAARAAIANPKFRSTLHESGLIVRRYSHVDVGFAVPLPDDELATAVVQQADTLDLKEFVRAMRSQMRRARAGETQVDEKTTLLVSTLSRYGITDAVPILVSPAVAVLFVGAPYSNNIGVESHVNITLTFDHRIINGVGAAKFLLSLEHELKQLCTGIHENTNP